MMRMATFEEIKAEGEKMNAEDRIAYLEKNLDWVMGFLEIEYEDRKKAQKEAAAYKKKLADLKTAIQDLL